MILHLAPDTIFTEYLISFFKEATTKNNTFLVDLNNSNPPKKVKKDPNVVFGSRKSNSLEDFIKTNLDKIEQVFVHHLSFYRAHLINKYFKDTHVTWLFYGSDVYESYSEFEFLSFLPQTKKSIGGNYLLKNKLRNYLRPLYFNLKSPFKRWNFSKTEVLQKINVFASADRDAFEMISKKLNFSSEWKWFTFYDFEKKSKGLNGISIASNHMIIGNSANPYNNHIEIFSLLKKYGIDKEFDKIIVPLSYGDRKCAKYLNSYGKNEFGNIFLPLNEFLDLDKYNEILEGCKVMIMNNLRPMATGNIITSLFLGSYVFLNESNPLFNYFNKLGVKIFSIQNDIEMLKTKKKLLTTNEMQNNRKVILSIYNRQNIILAIKNMLV